MAEAGSWPSIARHGLLSTSALLDLYGIDGPDRTVLEAHKRPESVSISHPKYGEAVIRDNKPINETVLRRTLEGMTESEFYRTLNGRVFFWLTEERLNKLRLAPPYKGRAHDILTVDTARLLERHGDRIELSPLNSGAVHPAANYPRGAATFRSPASYPWQERLGVKRNEPIVELTVPYSVPDIAEMVLDVALK
jgi:hypothetical protein